MATYTIGPDRFAGWQGVGRQFTSVALASAGIASFCWIAAHGAFGQLRAASDQLFVSIILSVSLGLRTHVPGSLGFFGVFSSFSRRDHCG